MDKSNFFAAWNKSYVCPKGHRFEAAHPLMLCLGPFSPSRTKIASEQLCPECLVGELNARCGGVREVSPDSPPGESAPLFLREEDRRYRLVGLGRHTVDGMSSTLLHVEVLADAGIPVRLFIPEHVAYDFMIYQISTVTTGEDGVKREDHVLQSNEPVPAALFSSIVELSDDVLRIFRVGQGREDLKSNNPRQYPWPLKMCRVKKGDQLRLGVTNINGSARALIGAFLVLPVEEEARPTS